MAEQPTGQPVDRVGPVRVAPAGVASTVFLAPLPRRRPRVVVRADLLPGLSVLAVVALLGVPLGWLWSRLAPAEHVLVYQDGQLLPLTLESYHRFDDLVLYLLLGLAVGVVTGVAVWLLRRRRGPVVVLAAVLGSGLAAWLGMRTGLWLAAGHYPLPASPEVGSVLAVAPRLESGWAVLTQPFGTALAYGCLAAWNGMDDLGRRL
ncbi:DUF2567 domain-containing protein [Goodfellowiella coeruleoviolacea]|uniref:DUF2567 domain-containing protein n=1 Tax=Goodfellowiella coeruleoviolacea TaxID=334858 RepID=A0AAE3KJD4_9PSEU|nr:DUF2567 domain-containing protein [Goodfellowiella coeruleoviolacea]MCP2169505.1 Protein of unknown function (DUF2567) [Goodfellowiella coeruleoviolacea]